MSDQTADLAVGLAVAEPAATDRYRAPALDKGLDILEVLAGQARGLTRAEIVKELGLSHSHLYRMLERLVARGYVARLDGGDRYALSMKLFVLATGHPPLRRLIAQAQPLMDDFARIQRQSCHLVVPEHGIGLVVAQASPPENWEFRVRVGAQIDLFGTGSGITLLAFQAPERLAETLGTWGLTAAATGPRLARRARDINRIRLAGYRSGPSGQAAGVTDLSVPILGPGGDAMAVLTCAYIEHPGIHDSGPRRAALEALRALGRLLSLDGARDQAPG